MTENESKTLIIGIVFSIAVVVLGILMNQSFMTDQMKACVENGGAWSTATGQQECTR